MRNTLYSSFINVFSFVVNYILIDHTVNGQCSYVILLLCMFCSVYSVSLCCSVCYLCVNAYCTTATRCQPTFS